MDESIYRKKSLDRITSPEALGDYLHVTSPTVWLILTAIVLLLVGVLVWSSVASIDSFATGTAVVEDGNMRISFDNEQIARNVQSGMNVLVGESSCRIISIGTDEGGRLFALAPTTLADGSYTAKVVFRQEQVIRLLFN